MDILDIADAGRLASWAGYKTSVEKLIGKGSTLQIGGFGKFSSEPNFVVAVDVVAHVLE